MTHVSMYLAKLGLHVDQTISGNVVIVIEYSYMCYLLSVPYVLFCASITFFSLTSDH